MDTWEDAGDPAELAIPRPTWKRDVPCSVTSQQAWCAALQRLWLSRAPLGSLRPHSAPHTPLWLFHLLVSRPLPTRRGVY